MNIEIIPEGGLLKFGCIYYVHTYWMLKELNHNLETKIAVYTFFPYQNNFIRICPFKFKLCHLNKKRSNSKIAVAGKTAFFTIKCKCKF